MPQSAPGQLTRQQIYDRIRQSSKDEYILEEMIRLGFWPQETELPSPSATAIKRQGELERELRELMSTQRMMDDPEQALKEMRRQRMAASREKREENKRRRIREAYEKTLAWRERSKKEILFVGPDFSKGMQDTANQTDQLARLDLPDLPHALALSQAMGISLSELRFLTFTRATATVTHYQRFEISKKTGGTRQISAPMPRLKRAQYWILENVLNKIDLPDTAHGFVPSRSILTNARPHVGARVVVNLDLKDFFPTITYARVKGLFRSLGYSGQTATLLALLCSEPATDNVRLDGKDYYVSNGPRVLPQGAPTSPAITNIICRRMDRRLAGTAAKLGFTYTRYADDMTYSGDTTANGLLQKLLWRTRQIITTEGFALNEAKTRIMHNGRRQEVTGIVVNRKLAIDRRTLKKFRALLFQIDKDGPLGKTWGSGGDIFESIQGYANFIKMVDAEKGRRYLEQVRRLRKKYKYAAPETASGLLNKHRFRKMAAAGQPPKEEWWQPAEKPQPELLLPEDSKSKATSTEASQAESPSLEEEPATAGDPEKLTAAGCFKLAAAIFAFLVLFKISPVLGILGLIILYFSKQR